MRGVRRRESGTIVPDFRSGSRMNRQVKALRQIVGECDSWLFHTRPNMPYRGLDSSGLRDGFKIIRKIAIDGGKRQNTRHDSSRGPRKRSDTWTLPGCSRGLPQVLVEVLMMRLRMARVMLTIVLFAAFLAICF
jgi:hypothetical protein